MVVQISLDRFGFDRIDVASLDIQGADFFTRTYSLTFDPGYPIRVLHPVFQVVSLKIL